MLRLIVLYHAAHNPYFGYQQNRKEDEEDEEGGGNAGCADVRNGCHSGEHVLYSPRLTTEFCHYPSCLACQISEREHQQRPQPQPATTHGDVLTPRHMTDDEEEEDEEGAHAHHYAEGIEVDGNVRHQLGTVLNISVTEVRHVLLELCGKLRQALVIGVSSLQLTIFCKSRDGTASALHLLLGRKLTLAIGTYVAVEKVVDAGHVAVEGVRGKHGESVGNGYAERSLATLGIVGLREGIDGSHGCKVYAFPAIIESFHGSELHGLHLSHLHSRRVAGMHCKQGSHDAHDACHLDALTCQLLLSATKQIPRADGTYEDGSDYP